MILIDEIERLAKAAGGDSWTPTYATRTDLAAVWLPDGDSVCRCHGNIGHQPDPIDADDVAEYIAAANPATILALTAELRQLRAEKEQLRTAAQAVLDWTESRHRPPMPEEAPCGETAHVRVHALVELHQVVTALWEKEQS